MELFFLGAFLFSLLGGAGLWAGLSAHDLEVNRCTMSYYHLWHTSLPIRTEKPVPPEYQLYRFHRAGMKVDFANEKKKKSPKIPILFIHGNSGSFHQFRSLASRLDSMQEQSGQPVMTDYYGVDFLEEKSALSGRVIWRQAYFVNEVIREILQTTTSSQILVIGHSMGGIIARGIFRLSNYPLNSVRAILTLGTPHRIPVFVADSFMSSFYELTNEIWERDEQLYNLSDVLVVSISGGFRDRMVEPLLSSMRDIVNSSHGVNYLSTSIPNVLRTVDHDCLMWCYQLVQVVAQATLDILKTSDPKSLVSYRDLFHGKITEGLHQLAQQLHVWKSQFIYSKQQQQLSPPDEIISNNHPSSISSSWKEIKNYYINNGTRLLDLTYNKWFNFKYFDFLSPILLLLPTPSLLSSRAQLQSDQQIVLFLRSGLLNLELCNLTIFATSTESSQVDASHQCSKVSNDLKMIDQSVSETTLQNPVSMLSLSLSELYLQGKSSIVLTPTNRLRQQRIEKRKQKANTAQDPLEEEVIWGVLLESPNQPETNSYTGANPSHIHSSSPFSTRIKHHSEQPQQQQQQQQQQDEIEGTSSPPYDYYYSERTIPAGLERYYQLSLELSLAASASSLFSTLPSSVMYVSTTAIPNTDSNLPKSFLSTSTPHHSLSDHDHYLFFTNTSASTISTFNQTIISFSKVIKVHRSDIPRLLMCIVLAHPDYVFQIKLEPLVIDSHLRSIYLEFPALLHLLLGILLIWLAFQHYYQRSYGNYPSLWKTMTTASRRPFLRMLLVIQVIVVLCILRRGKIPVSGDVWGQIEKTLINMSLMATCLMVFLLLETAFCVLFRILEGIRKSCHRCRIFFAGHLFNRGHLINGIKKDKQNKEVLRTTCLLILVFCSLLLSLWPLILWFGWFILALVVFFVMASIWDSQNASNTAYWIWVVIMLIACSLPVFPSTYEVFRSFMVNDMSPVIHTFDLLQSHINIPALQSLYSQNSPSTPTTITPLSTVSLWDSLFTLYSRLVATMAVLEGSQIETMGLEAFSQTTTSNALFRIVMHIFTSDLLAPVFLLIAILNFSLLPRAPTLLLSSTVQCTSNSIPIRSIILCLSGVIVILFGGASMAFFRPVTWLMLILYLFHEKRIKEK